MGDHFHGLTSKDCPLYIQWKELRASLDLVVTRNIPTYVRLQTPTSQATNSHFTDWPILTVPVDLNVNIYDFTFLFINKPTLHGADDYPYQ